MLQAFFKLLLLCCISVGAVCCAVSFRMGTKFPIALQLSQCRAYGFLNFLVLSSADCKISQSHVPSVFKAKYYGVLSSQRGAPHAWGAWHGSSLLFTPATTLLLVGSPWVHLAPIHISALFLSSMWHLLIYCGKAVLTLQVVFHVVYIDVGVV